MYDYNKKKQGEEKVKVKETDPTGSQNWFYPVALCVDF